MTLTFSMTNSDRRLNRRIATFSSAQIRAFEARAKREADSQPGTVNRRHLETKPKQLSHFSDTPSGGYADDFISPQWRMKEEIAALQAKNAITDAFLR
jgi:hypothetical protein